MRGKTKTREGVVVSNKMDKTVVVRVERRAPHPKYKKYLRLLTTVKAHDGDNRCQVGDRVRIIESRPLSARKRWRVRRVVRKATGTAQPAAVAK